MKGASSGLKAGKAVDGGVLEYLCGCRCRRTTTYGPCQMPDGTRVGGDGLLALAWPCGQGTRPFDSRRKEHSLFSWVEAKAPPARNVDVPAGGEMPPSPSSKGGRVVGAAQKRFCAVTEYIRDNRCSRVLAYCCTSSASSLRGRVHVETETERPGSSGEQN